VRPDQQARVHSPANGTSPWGDLGDSMERLFVDSGLNAKRTKRRDRITLHSLRHTFASWLAIAGVSLRRIQELLVVATGSVTTPVTATSSEETAKYPQGLKNLGGGGATRTPDLGIMRPSL